MQFLVIVDIWIGCGINDISFTRYLCAMLSYSIQAASIESSSYYFSPHGDYTCWQSKALRLHCASFSSFFPRICWRALLKMSFLAAPVKSPMEIPASDSDNIADLMCNMISTTRGIQACCYTAVSTLLLADQKPATEREYVIDPSHFKLWMRNC